MRVACLQFSPVIGDIEKNLNRAKEILGKADPKGLDLLVLPQLAFTGSSLKLLEQIRCWARDTALKYECIVVVSYPEKTWQDYYSSALIFGSGGELIADYRKPFLHKRRAFEGRDVFFSGDINGLGKLAMGTGTDLDPYKPEALRLVWEFALHVLDKKANLVVLSLAQLAEKMASSELATTPDRDALSYWISRLDPLIRARGRGEIIVVLANRCGIGGDAVYAGTSTILSINDEVVEAYGILGHREEKLLTVDTSCKSFVETLRSKPSRPCSSSTSSIDEDSDCSDFSRHWPLRNESLTFGNASPRLQRSQSVGW